MDFTKIEKAFDSKDSKGDLLSKLKLNKAEREQLKLNIEKAEYHFAPRFIGDIEAKFAIKNLSTTDVLNYFIPVEAKRRFIEQLTLKEKEYVLHSSDWILRKDQLLNFTNPTVLYMAGRGSGKSFAAIQTLIAKHWLEGVQASAIVGRTLPEARKYIADLVIANAPQSFKPRWTSSSRLLWPNGSITYVFTADKPDGIRGANIGFAICDELSSWRYPDAYAQLKFTMRGCPNPQVVITTTPKNNELTKEVLAEYNAIYKSGASFNNRRLPVSFFVGLIAKYPPGSFLYRQELMAELVEDNLDALFTQTDIDNSRIKTLKRVLNQHTGEYEFIKQKLPDYKKIIVAVDPAVTDKEESDESGIVVWGMGVDGKHYIIFSKKFRVKPYELVDKAIKVYKHFKANVLMFETNQGGDVWQNIIGSKDPTVVYKGYHSKVSKLERLQISAALMQHKVLHFLDEHPDLEKELINYDGTGDSPNLLDAMAIAGIEATEKMSDLESFVALSLKIRNDKKESEELRSQGLEKTENGIIVPMEQTTILTPEEKRKELLKRIREQSKNKKESFELEL